MSEDLNLAHDRALFVAENEIGWTFQDPTAASAASAAYERGWDDAIAVASGGGLTDETEKKMSKHTVRYTAQIDMYVVVEAADDFDADEIAHPLIVEYIDTIMGSRSLGVNATVEADTIDNYATEPAN